MEARANVLRQVLALLREEEQALSDLFALALEEQAALIQSDFEAINMISGKMLDAAGRVEELELNRLNLLRSVHADELTLEELLPIADDLGVSEFASARLELGARARELQDAQEQNARLLLNAMKLRDRWANLVAGYSPAGYGNDGRKNLGATRGAISRSA